MEGSMTFCQKNIFFGLLWRNEFTIKEMPINNRGHSYYVSEEA